MNVAALIIVFIFIVFDIATGWLKALSTGTTNSSIMRQGLYRKLAEIISVLFGYTCQYVFPLVGIDVNIPLAAGIATYIVLMETASIIENLGVMNPNLANVLSKFFSNEKLDNGESEGKHLEQKDKSANSD